MIVLKYANLTLAFLLELCALAALGYWGFATAGGLPAKIGLGVGVALLAAVLWGVFESPRASLPLPEPWHLLFALAFFGCAAAALYAAHHARVALVFALAVILNQVLAYVWGQ
jgi:hypothetical protein